MDIEAEIDALYRLSLAEFTAARNALAARAKQAGLAPAAARVRALAKPPAAAWAANQLFWTARGHFDALVDAAVRLRTALADGAAANDVRRVMQARSDALAASVKKAEAALVAGGHAASPAVLRRVQANLEALAAGVSTATPGRLSEDLEPPGLDALAGLMLADAPRKTADPESEPHTDRTAADSAARQRAAEASAAAHAVSMSRLEGARAEADEARRRLEKAEARLRDAEAAEAAARTALDAAHRALSER